MPKNKTKGSKIERELFTKFIEQSEGYRVARVAGSGTMENADCDLIAGTKYKKYGIEAKSSKKSAIYITKDQISRFLVFCEIFKLNPVIALRFNREGWLFIKPRDLKNSGKNWRINLEDAKEKGKRFSQFFWKESNGKQKKSENELERDYQMYLESLDEKNKEQN